MCKAIPLTFYAHVWKTAYTFATGYILYMGSWIDLIPFQYVCFTITGIRTNLNNYNLYEDTYRPFTSAEIQRFEVYIVL